MIEPADEFSFLPEQAAEAGLTGPVPHAERLALTLPDGRTLSALRFGSPSTSSGTEGGAVPVVTFLHGAGLNAHTWDTTILALGLPALAIDLPGHGDSSWREDAAYVARVLAPDIAAGLEAWTDRPQVVVGQSLGGLTGAALAASRPDLVRRLVVVDITPGVDPDAGPTQVREFFAGPTEWASRDELVDRALEFGLGGGSRRKAERGVYFNSRIRPDGRVEWKHHFAHLANAMAASAAAGHTPPRPDDALARVLGESGWDDFARVMAPVTLIRGAKGYVTAEDADEFARRVPAASVESMAGGHNLQEDSPTDLGRRIAEIAAEVD